MAKEKRDRDRLAFEVDPELRQAIEQWAALEGRTMSSLLRRILHEANDQRMAARGATPRRRSPIQKPQLSV
jgi:uncharacterized protein (DUF1778 family)